MPLFVTCVVVSCNDGKLPCGFCKCVYMASIHKHTLHKYCALCLEILVVLTCRCAHLLVPAYATAIHKAFAVQKCMNM